MLKNKAVSRGCLIAPAVLATLAMFGIGSKTHAVHADTLPTTNTNASQTQSAGNIKTNSANENNDDLVTSWGKTTPAPQTVSNTRQTSVNETQGQPAQRSQSDKKGDTVQVKVPNVVSVQRAVQGKSQNAARHPLMLTMSLGAPKPKVNPQNQGDKFPQTVTIHDLSIGAGLGYDPGDNHGGNIPGGDDSLSMPNMYLNGKASGYTNGHLAAFCNNYNVFGPRSATKYIASTGNGAGGQDSDINDAVGYLLAHHFTGTKLQGTEALVVWESAHQVDKVNANHVKGTTSYARDAAKALAAHDTQDAQTYNVESQNYYAPGHGNGAGSAELQTVTLIKWHKGKNNTNTTGGGGTTSSSGSCGGTAAAGAAGGGGAGGAAGGGAAGGAVAAGGAAGGATAAGGAGGGTDGTAGGVVGGGEGNNDSTPSGPNNNDVIPQGAMADNNNNPNNNNIVPSVPVVNNNDVEINPTNEQVDDHVGLLTAIVGLISKQNQDFNTELADMADKNMNARLDQGQKQDGWISDVQNSAAQRDSELKADIQSAADNATNSSEVNSYAASAVQQSAWNSLADSQELSSVQASLSTASAVPASTSTDENDVSEAEPNNAFLALLNQPAQSNQSSSDPGQNSALSFMNEYAQQLNGIDDNTANAAENNESDNNENLMDQYNQTLNDILG